MKKKTKERNTAEGGMKRCVRAIEQIRFAFCRHFYLYKGQEQDEHRNSLSHTHLATSLDLERTRDREREREREREETGRRPNGELDR
jgi:hypothetical protein